MWADARGRGGLVRPRRADLRRTHRLGHAEVDDSIVVVARIRVERQRLARHRAAVAMPTARFPERLDEASISGSDSVPRQSPRALVAWPDADRLPGSISAATSTACRARRRSALIGDRTELRGLPSTHGFATPADPDCRARSTLDRADREMRPRRLLAQRLDLVRSGLRLRPEIRDRRRVVTLNAVLPTATTSVPSARATLPRFETS